MPCRGIHNLMRALARPYPGATMSFRGAGHVIWRTRIATEQQPNAEPGKVLAVDSGEITVRTGAGAMVLAEHELPVVPEVGSYLGAEPSLQSRRIPTTRRSVAEERSLSTGRKAIAFTG